MIDTLQFDFIVDAKQRSQGVRVTADYVVEPITQVDSIVGIYFVFYAGKVPYLI